MAQALEADHPPEIQEIENAAPESSFDLDIYMAFQPVVDITTGQISSHEALVRGPSGRGEATVMARVNDHNRFDFDRKCRLTAIETAASLNIEQPVSINFMPSVVDDSEDFVQTIQWAADEYDFPVEHIILEYSEVDRRANLAHLKEICRLTRRTGLRTAIDDFGVGYAGLARLSALRPALVKLDASLIRRIDVDPRRRSIVAGTMAMCLDLGIELVAKGVETEEEYFALQDCGISQVQGNLLAPPMLEGAVAETAIVLPTRTDA